jgi:general secretion pathway protein M
VRTWEGLQTRERRLVAFMLVFVLATAVWMLGLAPALRVLRTAPQQLDALDQQLQTMQRLAAEAGAIQSRPPMTRDAAVRALETSVRQRLGAATQVRMLGDRATVVLQSVPPDALAQWLAQVRTAARAVPVQSQLRRNAQGWDGTVVLELPPA